MSSNTNQFVKLIDGYWFPVEDEEHNKTAVSSSTDLDLYYTMCNNFNVAVQAGGNVGIWPDKMSTKFKVIYTFEPDHNNFYCLVKNVSSPNVIKLQAALGAKHERVAIDSNAHNCGADRVLKESSDKKMITMTVDDLNLDQLDFLMLDVEGYELKCIEGGMETISKYKPLIVMESKPWHQSYFGYDEKYIMELLRTLGYSLIMRVHRDIVFKCV